LSKKTSKYVKNDIDSLNSGWTDDFLGYYAASYRRYATSTQNVAKVLRGNEAVGRLTWQNRSPGRRRRRSV